MNGHEFIRKSERSVPLQRIYCMRVLSPETAAFCLLPVSGVAIRKGLFVLDVDRQTNRQTDKQTDPST